MSDEILAGVTAVLLAAAVVVARTARLGRHRTLAALSLCALAAAAVVRGRLLRPAAIAEAAATGRPIELTSDQERSTADYVTSSRCRACHPRQYATWHDSYHRTMTQRARPGAVLGDFADVTLTRAGKQFKLQQQDGEFWVEMEDPPVLGGQRARRRIAMTTGSHHMQVFWYESGYSRITGLLPFTWLVDERRWISRAAAFVLPFAETIEPELGEWSIRCIKCHATAGRPLLDWDNGGLHDADTQVGEFGIACEACHGPAAAHVAANHDPLRRWSMHLSRDPDPTIVNPARLQHRRSTEVCGQCHGIHDYRLEGSAMAQWFQHGFQYRPGDELAATRTTRLDGKDGQFWSDGAVRVAGREYSALLGSLCYERGELSCLSCHVLHQASDDPRPRRQWADDQLRPAADDANCLRCHPKYRDDVQAHSHHAEGSEGSRCYNCHMPHSTYGLLGGVRNHRIQSPSVASTLATGRPNACNLCHLDRTLAWTADAMQRWYGTEPPKLADDDRTVAAAVNWALKGDAAQRALVAWSFGWPPAQAASGRDWIAPYLAELLVDPYEAVRLIAQRSLRRLPGHEQQQDDLLGSAEQRTLAKGRTLERWRASPAAAGAAPRPALLLGPDGALQQEPFERLLKLRNNRPVQLAE